MYSLTSPNRLQKRRCRMRQERRSRNRRCPHGWDRERLASVPVVHVNLCLQLGEVRAAQSPNTGRVGHGFKKHRFDSHVDASGMPIDSGKVSLEGV